MQRESYEIISDQNEAVGKLVATLPRVEAPSDFEMRVRARIASGRKAGTSWLTPLVRVAVPAALLIAIGGYFGYYAIFRDQSVPVSQTVTAPETKPVQPPVQPVDPVNSSNEIAVDSSNPRSVQRDHDTPRDSRKSPNSITDRPGGGSYVEAGREPKRIYPRGVDPNIRRMTNVDPSVSSSGISPKSVFEAIGISANYKSKAWKVSTVTANSMAEKAGVKVGDTIEEVNEQKLTQKTTFGRTFIGTSLRVRRDGQSITLDLKP